MISILTWVSIITGGILVLLLLISIIGGMDFDLDIGDTEVESDGAGLGVIKGFLTLVSVASWVIKIFLAAEKHVGIAVGIGLLSGISAFLLLNYLLKLLLRNEENVNWSIDDALFQQGEVYLKIPGNEDNGLIHVNINGALRELKAKSFDKKLIATGATITVVDTDGEFALVQEISNQ